MSQQVFTALLMDTKIAAEITTWLWKMFQALCHDADVQFIVYNQGVSPSEKKHVNYGFL